MSRALQRRETIAGYLFMLPSLIFFIGFVVIPMIVCIFLSLTDANMHSPGSFIGLGNFFQLWQDEEFLAALKNTFVIVIVSVPTVCAFSLWVSSTIYRMKGPILSAFRCIFYLPVVTGSVAVTVVWAWMYHNYYGVFNYILGPQGLGLIEGRINWLGDERFALGCIILILFTTSVGQPIVLYVSALGNVDQTLIEAAEVDGATEFQVFWKVKWAQMLPTTLYILVITTINSFQCFALIQLLTKGGAGTDTVMYRIYWTAFKLTEQAGHFGYANAMGVVLAIFIGILSAVQFKLAQEK